VIEVPYNFAPRSFQRRVLEAFEQGCRRAALVWHRRAAKSTTIVQLPGGRRGATRGRYSDHFSRVSIARAA
jgi:hypothetical protein